MQDAWRGDTGPLWRGYECRGCRYVWDCLLPTQHCRKVAIEELANLSQRLGLYEPISEAKQ